MNELIILREKIDNIDEQIVSLFNERMETIKKVSMYKLENNLPIKDFKREKELIDNKKHLVNKDFANYYEQLYKGILKISKDYQEKLLNERKNYDIK